MSETVAEALFELLIVLPVNAFFVWWLWNIVGTELFNVTRKITYPQSLFICFILLMGS